MTPSRLCLPVLLWLSVATLSGQSKPTPPPYIWPLRINNGYSSSFQEFRGNHFHAGMDLRTLQSTGHPVLAIADGRVVKIRLVKHGSGRGLYIKLRDGNTAIYFHLDRFAPKIEEISRAVQLKQGKKYFGNHWLTTPLSVRRGEVVAYSGETGSGFPHLHLEIRDREGSALNPFPLIDLPTKDNRAPILRSLVFRSRDGALLNGHTKEQVLRFRRLPSGLFRLQRPLVATGPLDLILNCRDVSDCGKYVAPVHVRAALDDREYFAVFFDRFSWEDNNQLGFVYDMRYSNPGNYFFNLFTQTGYLLEEKRVDMVELIRGMGRGRHEGKIVVSDNFGNSTEGRFELIKVAPPVLDVSELDFAPDRLTVSIRRLLAEDSDTVRLRVLGLQGQVLYRGTLGHRSIQAPRPLVLKGMAWRGAFLEFAFIKENVVYAKRSYLLDPSVLETVEGIQHSIHINREQVMVQVKKPYLSGDSILLRVTQSEQTRVLEACETRDNVCFRFSPRGRPGDVGLEFLLTDRNRILGHFSHVAKLIPLRPGEPTRFREGEFTAEFGATSVREPRVLEYVRCHHAVDYPLLSEQVSLAPFSFPFLDTVYYAFEKNLENPRQVGIFRFNPVSKGWRYAYTEYDGRRHTYRTRVISSGIFALLRDVYRPKIGMHKIPTTRLSKLKQLVFTIRDKGKGVDDETLWVTFNDERVDCEYDPDWRHVKVEDLQHLSPGTNRIRIRVRDHAGNQAQRGFTLNLN